MEPKRSTLVGLSAAFAVTVIAGIFTPFTKLTTLSLEEFLLVRGGMIVVCAGLFFTRQIRKPSRMLLLSMGCLCVASYCFFMGVRVWSAAPVSVIQAGLPAVSFLVRWQRGEQVSKAGFVCLLFMFASVAIALEFWETSLQPVGLVWALLSLLFGGVALEALGRASAQSPATPAMSNTFWLGVATALTGLVVGGARGTLALDPATQDLWSWVEPLALFGLLGGFIYFWIYAVAYKHLSSEVAGTITRLENLAVVVGAVVVLNEEMTSTKWVGACVAVAAAGALSYVVAHGERQ